MSCVDGMRQLLLARQAILQRIAAHNRGMTRHGALIAGTACASAFVVLALVVGLAPAAVDPLDVWWNEAMIRGRSDAVVGVALILNVVGGGWIATAVVPVALALAALLARGWRAAIVVIVTMLASVAAVQLMKGVVARERPLEMLVTSDFGSFPSGHTANAATVAIVLCVLLPRAIGIPLAIVWTSLMAASRTVLSVHWLTDTLGGALLGAGAALLVVALFAPWTSPRRPTIRQAKE